MKYKVGDKVRIKPLEWYNLNKNYRGDIELRPDRVVYTFVEPMSAYCGKIAKITGVNQQHYDIDLDSDKYFWTDDMFEGKVENSKEDKSAFWFLPEGYEFCDDEGRVIPTTKVQLRKKQPQYPKTYEECCKIVNANSCVRLVYNLSNGQKYSYDADNLQHYENIRKLLICRDSYWKIAGGWTLDYDADELFFISNERGCIVKTKGTTDYNTILVFPTKEMRDSFYESFKELIEICKDFL